MKTLSQTWFADGYIDFELKKYTLLAYLQEVTRYFNAARLYPQLGDLIFHYNNLVAFRENKKYLQEQFPKRLTGIQLEKLQLLYEQMIEDDGLMQELESIIHFSIATMKTTISSGAELYEQVEESLQIQPVGLVPVDNSEGFLLLRSGNSKDTGVYQYRLGFFERHDEQYRTLKTTFIENRTLSLVTTYEHIKLELIRCRPELWNPAVYCIETGLSYPVEETLLPIAKRSFVKFLRTAA
ncbi:MAG TPA: hypothetical protein PKE63_04625 [Lacibacter sp.]|nr:hypothetical protein [Lacibacter sp.]HMO89655.1 hypothetical protein [Lacibacter sp.]HMP86537.1 hypothetical protein [Lacibacter sp.]